jgi:hypothetical protein
MIATSGDEAFVMLALFPKEAMFLFAVLFIGYYRCPNCGSVNMHRAEDDRGYARAGSGRHGIQ